MLAVGEDAGIRRLPPTYGTRLRQHGADVAKVQALLNHASIETSARNFRAGRGDQADLVAFRV